MSVVYLLIVGLFGVTFTFLLILKNKAQVQSLLYKQIDELKQEILTKEQRIIILNSELVSSQKDLEYSRLKQVEQISEVNAIKEQFTLEFENLANRIFEEKSTKFSQQNQTNISNLLTPLNEKIKDFEKQVATAYNLEGKERAALKEQIQMLSQLNQQMSIETQNLTQALKSDNKAQGNWGEMILESILEKSGLVKNREYFLQQTHLIEDGKRYKPDVIIKLPQDKLIIIDAKVSLNAYERFIASNTIESQNLAIKEHVLSLTNHIKVLSSKNYHNLHSGQSLDFVLLFIPIESAFALALQNENGLFDLAFANNIVLVCPSTLLATLRTVANIWRSEKSAQNTQEIAKLGGELYDRLVNFLNIFETINISLITTQSKYNDALTKLNGNRGIIKSAIKLKELGARTSKILDNKWNDD